MKLLSTSNLEKEYDRNIVNTILDPSKIMPSPFPGMDPYLEDPAIWPSLHHWLITEIARNLNPQLRPKYVAAVEVRIYESSQEPSTLVGIPDDIIVQRYPNKFPVNNSPVAVVTPSVQPITVDLPIPETIKQGYLEIRQVGTGKVITVIEVLSPINKKPGEGRQKYELKRDKILGSSTHLIEIDLLRQGLPMPMFIRDIKTHYRILVSRSHTRPKADLYAFNLPDSIPSFPLPLLSEDAETIISLQELFNQIYDLASYDLMIDYNRDLLPSVLEDDAEWAKGLLQKQGMI